MSPHPDVLAGVDEVTLSNNEEYDHGRILGQATIAVLTTDTVDSLAARVLEREKTFFVEVLQRIAESGLDL